MVCLSINRIAYYLLQSGMYQFLAANQDALLVKATGNIPYHNGFGVFSCPFFE
jgi:hypothetical protein